MDNMIVSTHMHGGGFVSGAVYEAKGSQREGFEYSCLAIHLQGYHSGGYGRKNAETFARNDGETLKHLIYAQRRP